MEKYFVEKENKEEFFKEIDNKIKETNILIDFVNAFPSLIAEKKGKLFNIRIVEFINNNTFGIKVMDVSKDYFNQHYFVNVHIKYDKNEYTLYVICDEYYHIIDANLNSEIFNNMSNQVLLNSLNIQLSELKSTKENYDEYLKKLQELADIIQKTNKIPLCMFDNIKYKPYSFVLNIL